LIQPFFGAVRPFLMIFNVTLEVSYPAFGRLKLKRKIASDVQCMLAIFFSCVSRSMKQAQNGLPS
jgi:hypothetical protein